MLIKISHESLGGLCGVVRENKKTLGRSLGDFSDAGGSGKSRKRVNHFSISDSRVFIILEQIRQLFYLAVIEELISLHGKNKERGQVSPCSPLGCCFEFQI